MNKKSTMTEDPNYFQDTKNRVKQYIDQRLLLLRLQAMQKISRIAAGVVTIIIISVVALFLIVFASITAGYWLASVTGSLTAGFGIVALFYLVVFLFVTLFLRKILQNMFINTFIKLFHKKD
ncbi:MAG: phage holin family protein [Parafilimonas sp.]